MSVTTPTILIVEDHALNAELLQRRLAKWGYDTHWEADPRLVLPLLEQKAISVILLDLSIPYIDGWTLAGMLKADEQFGQIPIIALTAHAMRGDREKALQAGCDAYLSKPLDMRVLKDLIETHCPGP